MSVILFENPENSALQPREESANVTSRFYILRLLNERADSLIWGFRRVGSSMASLNGQAVTAALVADNVVEELSSGLCDVCQRGLFSSGLCVIYLPRCRHFFHEECLNRAFRTRRRDNEGRACPSCSRHLPESELVEPMDFRDLSTTGHVPRTVAMAKKLVQKVLWTSITANVVPLLTVLEENFVRAPLFDTRHEYVQGAGLISALYHLLEKYSGDELVCLKVFHMLSACLKLGNVAESLDFLLSVDRMALIQRQSISSSSAEASAASMRFLHIILKNNDPQNNDNVLQWSRMIQSIIAAMRQHDSHTSVLLAGSKLLRSLSVDDTFVGHIVNNGGLQVLYAAQKAPHRARDADECLQHILALNLRVN